MKKLFSLLMLLTVFAIGMRATDVTFSSFGASNWTTVTADDTYTQTSDGVTLLIAKGTSTTVTSQGLTDAHLRIYKGAYITISSSNTITKIELTCTASGTSNYGPGKITADGYSYSGNKGTWEGSSNSVTLTASEGQARATSIVVTYSTGGTGMTIAAPTINVDDSQNYTPGTSVPVTITNNDNNNGTSVYYCLNDGEWTAYNAGFNVTETTVIKAKAVNGEYSSSTVTKTVTFVAAPTTVTTVAEFNALELDTEFTYNAALTAIGQTGQNLYAQDATGNGILIYGSVGQSYEQGAVIPSGWKAKRGEYKGTREATNPSNFSASQSTTTLASAELAISDITLDNIGKYGYVRGVTVNGNKISDGTNEVATYTSFESVPSDVTDKTFDVRGVVGAYNGNVQFLPFEYTPVGTVTPTKHTAPVFSLDPEKSVYTVGDVVTVTITSEDNNVNIGHNYHPTEGIIANFPTASVPISNGDSFTITASEPTTYELKAFAYGYEQGDELENSDITTINVQFIAAPDPLPEGSHMIVFGDNGTDATQSLTNDGIIEYITEGADYVSSVTDINKVFKGTNGLKFSTGSVNGTMTLNFAQAFTNVSQVIVNVKQYVNDVCQINGVDVSGDFADYTIATNVEELSSLTLTATKRVYVKSINIVTGDPIVPEYEVTISPESGTYTAPITVTITTANAAEGDELIMYTIDDTDPADSETAIEYTEPFTLSESATVKVYALDAEMNEATTEAEYVINIPTPTTGVHHMIVFGDYGADQSTTTDTEELLEYITEGVNYVSSASDIDKVYKGATGLKFSSSKANGTITINFTGEFTDVTEVIVNAKQYGSDACEINGVSVSGDFADYTIATNVGTLSSLTLTATKRLYVKSIDIVTAEEDNEITLANLLAEGEYGKNYTVTDALTIAEVSVAGNHVYAADAQGNWIRLDVGQDVSRNEVLGYAVNVTGVFTGRGIAPALTVSSLGELSQGFTVQINTMRLDQELEIPMPNQVVKLVGYYHDDDNTLSSYSGNNPEGAIEGSDPRGQVITLNGANAGDMHLIDGTEYEIVSAIVYKEAWTPANAPRRISPSDGNAFTNLQADVVDGSAATPTGVVNVKNAKNVKNVRYFNVAGVESSTPFDGINIVVTRYTDGTTTTSKMRK